MRLLYKKSVFIALILVFIAFSDVFSQGKILGTIKDTKYDTPIKEAVVGLYYDNEKISATNSDGTGFFSFNDLKYGFYELKISLEGYSSYEISYINLSEKTPNANFDTIKLEYGKNYTTVIMLKRVIEEFKIKNEIIDTKKEENSIKKDNTGKNNEYKIKGSVRDQKDFLPIKDASVLLFRNDDSLKIAGTGTDEKGQFEFIKLDLGQYKIEISYIGYSVKRIKNIILDEKNPVIRLDSIRLNTNQYKTDEIVVQDEKPLMEFNDDKKVFNVDKMMTSKGGTAIDVLKKLPMIDVDAQDNVTLRGSANVKILIDNKPMKFASLRQLPADAIKNVEIITNPSAKYESEGVTGIINIVMMENENKGIGYNGYLYSSYRDNQSYNSGLGFDLKKNRWTFFLNGGLGRYKYKNDNTGDITYFQPLSYYNSISNGNGDNKYYYGGFGAEYELAKDHNMGADFYYNKGNYGNTYNSKNYNYNDVHLLSSLYTNLYSGDGDNDNIYGSLYYNGKFDKTGKELNFDATYSKFKNKYSANQNIQYFDSLSLPVSNIPSVQMNTNNDNNSNLRIQLDLTYPLNEKTKFETGYKGIIRASDNDFTSDTLNYINNAYVRNNDLTNHFKLTDYINALYATYSQKIKNFRFKLGLRLEHTLTDGSLITNGIIFSKNYLDVFPTVTLSRKFGMAHELQVSYSRRITRPGMYRLNPFVRKSNLIFINVGNPELEPEYSDSYELSYIFISNPINITPVGFYRRTTNVISNYSYIIDTNVTVTTYNNAGSGYSYGMDFIVSSRALKWWNINSTFSFYKIKYDAGLVNDYSGEEGFSWRANIRSFFTIGEIFNLEVYYNYNGKRINSSGFNQPSGSLDISINKNFFRKKLTIGIRGEDLFKTNKWGSETNGVGVKSVYNYNWDSRGVYLNINYNFGNSEDYYKKSRNTKQNENEKSDSNEQGNK